MTFPPDADDALVQEALGSPPPYTTPAAPSLPTNEAFPTPASAEPRMPEPETIPKFDDRHREPFEGLLFLGSLTSTEIVWGHTFRLVTPSSAERLRSALLIREYDGTVAFQFAYAASLVASYLIEVDRQPLPMPVTTDPKDVAIDQRFEWILNNLRKPVIDVLFEKCLLLDEQVRVVLDAMGKA